MKKYLLGLFDDEEVLLKAVDKMNENNVKITDVVTPFAVHGLDHKLGLRESKLHIGGFWIGATGLTIAFSLMTWVFTANWPQVYGGKPHFSFPAFIPIMFEFTVLSASAGMTLAFLILNHLWPGRIRESLDPRLTSHMFGMVFRMNNFMKDDERNKIEKLLKEAGAVEVNVREMQKHY